MAIRRAFILAAGLCLLALQQSDKPRFIHPKLVLVPAGRDIPVQAWIGRHPDNRAVSLSWGGDGCAGGSSAKSLDGEYEPAVYPLEPLKVRMGQGHCLFSVAVLGAGGKLRGSARLEVCAVGPDAEC